MAWREDWTPEIVQANYKALGIVDHEDIEQLLEDSIRFQHMMKYLGSRHVNDLLQQCDEQMDDEDPLEQDN